MRATWVTSIIGGVVYGFLTRLTEIGKLPIETIFVLFFVIVTFFVIGIIQLKGVYRGRSGLRALFFPPSQDLNAFYLPIWSRMLIFIAFAIVSQLTTKALGI